MSIGALNTVWILGAGFSKALGGLLLPELFRPRRWGDDLGYFPDAYPMIALDLFMTSRVFNLGKDEGLWANAEEFLAFVDGAYNDGDRPVELGKGSGKSVKLGRFVGRQNFVELLSVFNDTELHAIHGRFGSQFDRIARRALAAECSFFLQGLNQGDERWRPYREWVNSLDPARDTVLTFNYDLVLETIGSNKLNILRPEECDSLPTTLEEQAKAGVPVLKLHGSVNWICPSKGKNRQVQRDAEGPALKIDDPDVEIAIAAPGPSKALSVGALFPKLWKVAKERLTTADAVVSIGYSFPATDAMARLDLLDAIARYTGGVRARPIVVIMGPDTGRPDVRRVVSLLEACKNTRVPIVAPEPFHVVSSNDRHLHVVALPLYGEDFIAGHDHRLRNLAEYRY